MLYASHLDILWQRYGFIYLAVDWTVIFQLEKLRSRVIQLAFQGSENWDSCQISDDGLVSTLRIYLFERQDLQKKVKVSEVTVTITTAL